MMKSIRPLLFLSCLLGALAARANAAGAAWAERADWRRLLDEAGVRGTIAVLDERSGSHWVCDSARANTRFLPASTFKIPHTLFALDAGLVRDEFQVFRWDSTRRWNAAWNQDQDLRSAVRRSVVWVYQGFARALGERREREYMLRIGYGNADASGGVDGFWLDGGLRISAFEELEFLRRLYRNALPFRIADQRLVKDVLVYEAGREWILRAKTGWVSTSPVDLGWWVGWVERPEGAVFFAINIDMPDNKTDPPRREEVARAVLRSIGALPEPDR